MKEGYGLSEASNEEMLARVEDIFNQLPLAYKRFVTFQDRLLIIRGLKGRYRFSICGRC